MNFEEALQALDIDILTKMFEGHDYASLRDWVISRSQTVASVDLSRQEEQFYEDKANAILACRKYARTPIGGDFAEYAEDFALSELNASLRTIFAYPVVSGDVKSEVRAMIQNKRLRRAERVLTKLSWSSVDAARFAQIAFVQSLSDPMVLLSRLADIFRQNFMQIKRSAQESIQSLIEPLSKLDDQLKDDIARTESKAAQFSSSAGIESQDDDEQRRIRSRLEELFQMRAMVVDRTERALKAAQLSSEIAANVKRLVRSLDDQMNWLKKRAQYMSTLTTLTDSVSEISDTARADMRSTAEEFQSIRRSIAPKTHELHQALQETVEDREILRRILQNGGTTLKIELELTSRTNTERLAEPDFKGLSRIIREIGEL